MDELKSALRNYGEWILAKQLGGKDRASPIQQTHIQKAREILHDDSLNDLYHPRRNSVKSIFSIVSNEITSEFPLKILSMKLDIDEDQDRSAIWNKFQEDVSKGALDFETFYNIYRKYAWYIPSSLPMEEISLFEQFKAVAALSHCLKKSEKLLLVGGDLPGIQNMVYTITSKGAAKSLRGRSFYIQMLCDVVLQSVLRELDLPSANVVYSAGGNFKLLASAADEEKLEGLRKEINDRLLDCHKGELFAVIDWVGMDSQDVVSECAFAANINKLSKKLGISKRRWFAEQARSADGYDNIFEPRGRGGSTVASDSEGDKNFCEVCHVEVDKDSRCVNKDDGTTKCKQCDSFEELTKMLDKDYLVMESLTSKNEYTKPGKPAWNDVIKSLGYNIRWDEISQGSNLTRYRLNDVNFLPEKPNQNLTYSFKFIGNVMPVMTEEGIKYMKDHYGEDMGKNDIRNTTVMAEYHAAGIPRYAVLRMDVDGLSDVFKKPKNMLQTSALSSALSLFFDGWLNHICQKIDVEWRSKLKENLNIDSHIEDKLPYIIYSGGDDLFIVGPWDVMPILAERIRNDFASYVSRGYVSDEKANSCMTISAGITLCHSKFPIYQAADLAKEALDNRAKERKVDGKEKKDAIDFLGFTVGWGEEFDEVKELAFELANLIEVYKVPHALLTLLKTVAVSYQDDRNKQNKDESSDEIVYGRWMWQLAYGICRMIERTKSTELKERIKKINGDVLDIDKVKKWKMIRILNLPVRWAEYLIRKGE